MSSLGKRRRGLVRRRWLLVLAVGVLPQAAFAFTPMPSLPNIKPPSSAELQMGYFESTSYAWANLDARVYAEYYWSSEVPRWPNPWKLRFGEEGVSLDGTPQTPLNKELRLEAGSTR